MYVEHVSTAGAILPRAFPRNAAFNPVPLPSTHPNCRYPAGAANWTGDPWEAVNFHIEEPHYYQYQMVTNNSSTNVSGTNNDYIYAEAKGDLNCNLVYSSFTRYARVDSMNQIYSSGISIVNELE
jgi:hypothetical protein